MPDLSSSMPRTLRRLAELSLMDWGLLARLSLFSLFVSMQLYLKPLPLLIDHLARRAYQGNRLWVKNAARGYDSHQLACLTDIAARFSFGCGHCLVQSLLLFWLLCMRGETVSLCLGIRKENETVRGHAWIETNAGRLAETAEVAEQFVTILQFSSPHYM